MIESKEYDFIIIGSGIAGLYAALKLSELGKVIVLTKEKIQDSNTQYAQGGIAVVMNEEDSWQLHMKDTLQAGAGLCNYKNVEILVKEGPKQVNNLISLGMQFDKVNGRLDYTREGAHSQRRILHAGGDATGKEIQKTLIKLVRSKSNIEIKENMFAIDLLINEKNENKIDGILSWDKEGKKYVAYYGKSTIISSGGCGQVYKNTSNPEVTTGDGIAMAYRAGAEISDMEFVQFHPTTLYNPNGQSFLISESVRGEGAILRNSNGERFMTSYHEMADLAPRDVVARAILNEIKKGSKPFVWLDATSLGADYIEKRFPTIFNTVLEYRFDMRKEWIPVVPAAHYLMGGIKTDSFGRTNLENLYACGEAACTGVHGANRLASNSLLEGLVFANRVFESIKSNESLNRYEVKDIKNVKPYKKSSLSLDGIQEKLKDKMTNYAGLIRNEDDLKKLIVWIKKNLYSISNEEYFNEELWKTKNMLTVGLLITNAALLRNESRGAHFRSDYPKQLDEWKYTHTIQTILPEEKHVLE
jgi:L-aspartate oxidase